MKSYSLKISTYFINMNYLCGLSRVLQGLDISYRFDQIQEGRRGGSTRTVVQKLFFSCDDDGLTGVKKYLDYMVEDVYVTEPQRRFFFGKFRDVRKHPLTTFEYTIEEIIP